jgi:hypothetical protein
VPLLASAQCWAALLVAWLVALPPVQQLVE